MIDIISLSDDKRPCGFIREFIDFPKRLYRNEPRWVPWFDTDMKKILEKRHPFFDHSPGEFFLARENGRTLGRICVVANGRYRMQHGRFPGHFFFLDAVDRGEVFAALTDSAEGWARDRGCESLEGPMLFGGVYGSGILVEGFESPPPMTMMPYNYGYYPLRFEELGFSKIFDVVGADIGPSTGFGLPDRIASVADKVVARGRFRVLRFRTKRDLAARADEVAALYNDTLSDHFENYPLTDAELEVVKKDLLTIAQPDLIKILEYDGRIVGFLFAFRDLTPVLRKNGGRITPAGLFRLLAASKKNRKALFNGMGILPEFQRLGGNALLYTELARTVYRENFEAAEVVQINEHTDLMLKDIQHLGAVICKRHRIYGRAFL